MPAPRRATSPVATGPTLFSRADVEVIATAVGPRLPDGPRPGVRAEDLPQVEVVVSETGEVESVKLVSAARGVPGRR